MGSADFVPSHETPDIGIVRRSSGLGGTSYQEGYATGRPIDEPMLLPKLRKAVLEANRELVRKELALYTFGNASGISRKDGLVLIKPSGVPYEQMRPVDLVVTDLEGKVVEGKSRHRRIEECGDWPGL